MVPHFGRSCQSIRRSRARHKTVDWCTLVVSWTTMSEDDLPHTGQVTPCEGKCKSQLKTRLDRRLGYVTAEQRHAFQHAAAIRSGHLRAGRISSLTHRLGCQCVKSMSLEQLPLMRSNGGLMQRNRVFRKSSNRCGQELFVRCACFVYVPKCKSKWKSSDLQLFLMNVDIRTGTNRGTPMLNRAVS